MASQTVKPVETTPVTLLKKAKRFNRYDSPWFNSRLIIGSIMVAIVVLLGLIGPLLWDMNLAHVTSSPLNLPPAWIHRATPEPTAVGMATQDANSVNGGFGLSGLGGS